MSCDICGRFNCTPCFHPADEQERYEQVIEAFDKARALRDQVRESENDEQGA